MATDRALWRQVAHVGSLLPRTEIAAPMPKTKPPRETGHDYLRRLALRQTLVPIAPGVEMVAVEGEVALHHPDELAVYWTTHMPELPPMPPRPPLDAEMVDIAFRALKKQRRRAPEPPNRRVR